jgi:hypothetical protein
MVVQRLNPCHHNLRVINWNHFKQKFKYLFQFTVVVNAAEPQSTGVDLKYEEVIGTVAASCSKKRSSYTNFESGTFM